MITLDIEKNPIECKGKGIERGGMRKGKYPFPV
jgi:hypothetical protein